MIYDISIHAPLYGERHPNSVDLRPANIFQSTLPYGERRCWRDFTCGQSVDFNPRSPYGERRYRVSRSITDIRISIHAPLTGSDYPEKSASPPPSNFNPRSPYGERQRHKFSNPEKTDFNPRSLTGSDSAALRVSDFECHFNPRSPYGERPGCPVDIKEAEQFQSTLPYGERHDRDLAT